MKKTDKDIYNEFGKRIKELRNKNNLTQLDLSNILGISQATMAQYEAGARRIPLGLIQALSDYFNLSFDELIGYRTKKSQNDYINNDNKILGSNIKNLRNNKKISLEELSTELDISIDNLGNYENGSKNIPITELLKFANFFEVSVDQLVGFRIGDNRKLAVVTTDETLQKRYKHWQNAIGYDTNFTDDEIDDLINYAKYIIFKRNEK